MISRVRIFAEVLTVLASQDSHPSITTLIKLVGYGRGTLTPVLHVLEKEGLYQRPRRGRPPSPPPPNFEGLLHLPVKRLSQHLGVSPNQVRKWRTWYRFSTPSK